MKDGRCSWCAGWLKVYDDNNLGPHFCGTGGCEFLWHYEIKRKKAKKMSEEKAEMNVEGMIAAKDAKKSICS